MIAGIGCDIIEISRIAKKLDSEAFMRRCFTAAEREYIYGRRAGAAESAAACFAAKEAVSKALGTGIGGFSMIDIEIVHDVRGKPYVHLFNGAESIAGKNEIHLSLSHCREYAVAYAVIEQKERN